MNSVGIDLHRKRSHIAALDEEGRQLLSRRIVNDPQTFLALLEDGGECRIALEATYGWGWLADVLQDAGYELHLAHPMRTKAIASANARSLLVVPSRHEISSEAGYRSPKESVAARSCLPREAGRSAYPTRCSRSRRSRSQYVLRYFVRARSRRAASFCIRTPTRSAPDPGAGAAPIWRPSAIVSVSV
jgi:transposase